MPLIFRKWKEYTILNRQTIKSSTSQEIIEDYPSDDFETKFFNQMEKNEDLMRLNENSSQENSLEERQQIIRKPFNFRFSHSRESSEDQILGQS